MTEVRLRMVRGVLFDLDGVLINSYDAWFHLMNAAARDLGYRDISRDAFAASWGQPIEADVESFYRNHTVEELERYYDDHFRDHLHHVTVDPTARRVLAELHARGKSTAVITNTPGPIARAILDVAGLAVSALVGGTDVSRAKPAPDMVLRACELLDVAASEVVVVGDTHHDLQAARDAGARFAGLRIDGDHTLEQLHDILELVDAAA